MSVRASMVLGIFLSHPQHLGLDLYLVIYKYRIIIEEFNETMLF